MNPAAEAIRTFITESFLFGDRSQLPPDDASLLESGVLDSTDVLELVVFIEERFGMQVRDTEVTPENFDSVTRLGDFVSSRLEPAPTPL